MAALLSAARRALPAWRATPVRAQCGAASATTSWAAPAQSAGVHSCAGAAAPQAQGRLKYRYRPQYAHDGSDSLADKPLSSSRKMLFTDENHGARMLYLNRSHTLNTLDIKFIRNIRKQLEEWEKNNIVEVVVLKSSLDEFFCRGGDIKFLHEKAKNSATRAQALAYFREEYLLSHLIASYTKPIAMQLNGEVLGTSLSMLGLHRISQEDTVFSVPDVARGGVPGPGSSYILGRLRHGLGMYLGLTGHRLHGEENFWAGLTNIHSSSAIADEYLLYALGRASSTNRSNMSVERDEVFQRNMAFLNENRGSLRNQYISEEGAGTREDFRNFTRLKGWYQQFRRGRYEEAEKWYNGNPSGEEVGELFHFNTPPEMNDYTQPLEPDHKFLWDRVENAIGSVFHLDSDRMPADVAAKFNEIAEVFAGDPDQGDTILFMEEDPDSKTVTRDEYRAALKDKLLPADYESLVQPSLHAVVVAALIDNGVVPQKLEVEAVADLVRRLTQETWPYANPTTEAIANACHAEGLDSQQPVVQAILDSVVSVTSQVTGVPPSALVDEEVEHVEGTPLQQLTRALTDSDGAAWQDYFKTLDHMHSAHLAAAREDELMHVSDLTSSLHELQDGEDDSGAVAVGAIKSEDDMKRVAAELGAGDYEPFNVEQVELEAEVDEPTSPHHSKTTWNAAFHTADHMSPEYKEKLQTDPEAMKEALGMPNTPLVRKATKFMVRSLAAEKTANQAVPQVRSVDELYSRLNAKNSDFARAALASIDAASPMAVRLTHRLIVEGSTKTLAECLRTEHRVNARVLGTHDFHEGVEAAVAGRDPVWDTASVDVDSFFAPVAPGEDIGELSGLSERLRLFDDAKEAEARWEAELEKWYDSGEVLGSGSAELQSRFLWL